MGVVPLLVREPLVYADLGGRTLLASALATLASVGVEPVVVLAPARSPRTEASLQGYAHVDVLECPSQDSLVRERVAAAEVVVVCDPLCPLVPPGAVREVLGGWVPGTATVSVRPVVDTVKAARLGVVGATVDRDALCIVSSPVVVSGALLAGAPDLAAVLGRPTALVEWLRTRCAVTLVTAPPSSQRVEDLSSLDLLSAMGAVSG